MADVSSCQELQPACSVAVEASGVRSQMSIAPPGFKTPQASPPLRPPTAPQGAPLSHKEARPEPGNRHADDHVQHEFKTVQALRGRESSAKAKWQNQGWEFVSENRGTLRTELDFRRVKPKTLGAHLRNLVATSRRLHPKTQLVLVASCALILVAGTIGIVLGTQSGGDAPNPSATQTTVSSAPPAEPTETAAATAPPAESTVTDITVDELYDKLNIAGGTKVGDQFRVTAELVGIRVLDDRSVGGLLCHAEDDGGSRLRGLYR